MTQTPARPDLTLVPPITSDTESTDEPSTHPDILPEGPTNPVRVDYKERGWIHFFFEGVDLRRRKDSQSDQLVTIVATTHITLRDRGWSVPKHIRDALKAISKLDGVMSAYVQLNAKGSNPHWFAVKSSGFGDTSVLSQRIHAIIAQIPLLSETEAAAAS